MKKEINFAVIGIGKISKKSVIPAFEKVTQAKLSCLASSNESKIKALKKEYNQVAVCDYQTCLEDETINAVYIALPNHLHYEWTLKFLNAGKHVLCEKPLALSLEEAKQMHELAAEKNLILREAFMYRTHAQHELVKNTLKDNLIGEPEIFQAAFTYDLKDLNNIRLKKKCGGGALYDVGCYLIDSIHYLFKTSIESVSVQAEIGRESCVDEKTTLLFKCSNGMHAQLLCSTKLPRQQNYSIIGSKGSIYVPSSYIPVENQKVSVFIRNDSGEQHKKLISENQYASEIDEFCMCINKEDSGCLGFGLDTMRVIDEVRKLL